MFLFFLFLLAISLDGLLTVVGDKLGRFTFLRVALVPGVYVALPGIGGMVICFCVCASERWTGRKL